MGAALSLQRISPPPELGPAVDDCGPWLTAEIRPAASQTAEGRTIVLPNPRSNYIKPEI